MIIEVDEYKKKILGYNPEKSEDFHIESAKLADRDFIECLKTKKYKSVVLMAGGTASGKTEFTKSYLTKRKQLVYDGTLKEFKGFKIKLEKIERYDKSIKNIKVVLIIPSDTTEALGAFLKRDRIMKLDTFFDTQIRSKMTVAQILKQTKTRVEIYISHVGPDSNKLKYTRMKLARRRKKVADALISIAITLDEIRKDAHIENK